MNNRNRYFLGILIIALAAFAVFAPSYGFRLRDFLSPLAATPVSQTDTANLAAQNEQLRAQLAKLQAVASQLPNAAAGAGTSLNTVQAMVYSRYPLNFKSELLIDAGARDGIIPGRAVLFQGVLIGTVYKVFTDGSIVQTVFDPNFRIPVRIGASGSGATGATGSAGVDALLQGGAAPAVVSIAKSATVKQGDIIYSATPGIPYALPIGEVGNGLSASANNLFQQATVEFVYDVNSVQTVEVQR